MNSQAFQSLIEAVNERVKQADVFEQVHCDATGLRCQARDAESEAFYQVLADAKTPGKVWVGLFTPDRWLSESIEADLLHQGDKMEDLLDEELVELGFDAGPLAIEHFRDDAKVYVFRSALDVAGEGDRVTPGDIDRAVKVLLAYEACFRQLGDMSPTDEFA